MITLTTTPSGSIIPSHIGMFLHRNNIEQDNNARSQCPQTPMFDSLNTYSFFRSSRRMIPLYFPFNNSNVDGALDWDLETIISFDIADGRRPCNLPECYAVLHSQDGSRHPDACIHHRSKHFISIPRLSPKCTSGTCGAVATTLAQHNKSRAEDFRHFC